VGDKPTTPTLCTSANRGSCKCGTRGIKTYVFWPGEYQRCIYTFIPEDIGSPVPVLIHISAYGGGNLFPQSDLVTAAKYYGFAVFSLGSTGPMDGAGGFGLEFPNNGIINPDNPTPCSPEDSRDYKYIEGTLDFVDSLSSLDSSKVYFEGFSQNSMYAAYTSVCFADRVAGLWQGGSGLAKSFHTPVTPGFQGQCTASAFSEDENSCCNDNFCTDCTWWPIYPRTCDGSKLIDCIATYTNDKIACGTDWYMFNAMVAEGHDARMLSFAPTNGLGGHRNPANEFAWIVGCLGIVESCSSQCETSFLGCIESSEPDEFERCENELKEEQLNHCTAGCAPTLEMLKMSERPVVSLSEGKFGTRTGLTTNPQKPICDVNFGSFDDNLVNHNNCQPPNNIEAPPTDGIKKCINTPTTAPTSIENLPTTAPTPTNISPTPAPTPITSCTLAGSNCYRKNKWGGCDQEECKSLVCNDIPECCDSGSPWKNKCKKKANALCSPCPCSETGTDNFFLKTKLLKGVTVSVTKTCNWLGAKPFKRVKKICKTSDSDGINEPARMICPETCNIKKCP